MDHTHDAARVSWVASANSPTTDFPLQNLPLGVFRLAGEEAGCGAAIGDQVFNLSRAARDGLLGDEFAFLSSADNLDPLFASGRKALTALRHSLFDLLVEGGSLAPAEGQTYLHPMSDCAMQLPGAVRSFTDYVASAHHLTRCSDIFSLPDPLPHNYKWQPLAYNGRASTVRISGQPVRQPSGNKGSVGTNTPPTFGQTEKLDFELELGFFIGAGNAIGEAIPMAQASDHVGGFVLLNDWSARDLQFWEFGPLGPNVCKNFCTSISPWVVTPDALEPFRCPLPRHAGDPAPAFLHDDDDLQRGGFDIAMTALLQTRAMRDQGEEAVPIVETNTHHFYWSIAQMITAQAVTGCALEPGDLVGAGTASGPDDSQAGCLLERTWNGAKPLQLPNGEVRTYLRTGDSVTFRGRCMRDGYRSIGFGECVGQVID